MKQKHMKTYTGGFQARKLSMKGHILHSVRQNLDCNVTQRWAHKYCNE